MEFQVKIPLMIQLSNTECENEWWMGMGGRKSSSFKKSISTPDKIQ